MASAGSSDRKAGNTGFLIANGAYYLNAAFDGKSPGWGQQSCAKEFASEADRAKCIKQLREHWPNVYAVNVEPIGTDSRVFAERWADRIEAASREFVAVENKFAENGAYDSAAEQAAFRHGLERAAWLLRNRIPLDEET